MIDSLLKVGQTFKLLVDLIRMILEKRNELNVKPFYLNLKKNDKVLYVLTYKIIKSKQIISIYI